MAWGERAAEQHEKDQPDSCLRPDGVKPELEPIRNRSDFLSRLRTEDDEIGLCSALLLEPVDHAGRRTDEHYRGRIRAAEARMDQLVLMRAAQILDEAEQRRRDVMAKFGSGIPAELVLDDDERSGN